MEAINQTNNHPPLTRSACQNRPSSNSTAGTARKPYLTIRPRPGWQALKLLQIWHYRDLLIAFAGRDVKLRYRQTALGVIWVILQPLMAAAIFTFVFGKVAKLPSDGLPYLIFAYAGLLGWNLFSSTLGKAGACLVGNSQLLSKIYFPRLILPFSTVLSTLLDFLIALMVMVVLMVYYHVRPDLGILLLPLWLLGILMLAMGISLFTSALTVTYRDVAFIMPVLTQFLLYASPVAYAISRVPEEYRPWYFLNPLSALLEGFRWSLLGPPTATEGTRQVQLHWSSFPWEYAAYSAMITGLVFVAGALAFRKMERSFADVI